MTLELEIINPLDVPEWDKLLLSNPQSTFFHSQSWARVLFDTFQYTPLYFTAVLSDRLSALIPIMEIKSPLTGLRGVSLPFTDICEPIIDDPVTFDDVIATVLRYGEKSRWKTFVLSGGKRFLLSKTPSRKFYTHVVDLTRDEDQIFSSFRSSTKRNVNKALREGVEITMSTSIESMSEFYRLYAVTRKRHGTAIEPFPFFENVYKHIISRGKGIVALASYENSFVATAVFFHFGKSVFYQFGASDRNTQHLRPNNLIMWEAIRWFLQRGYESFSFGTSEYDNNGLRQFKNGMATSEETTGYYVYSFRKRDFIFHRSLQSPRKRKVLRIAPVPVLKILGKIFYKHTNSYYYLRKRDT